MQARPRRAKGCTAVVAEIAICTFAVTRPVTGARLAGSGRRNHRRFATALVFLLPAAAVYALVVIFPLVQASFYGLYKWNGLGPLDDYVGLDNFSRVLRDEVFRRALLHSLVILVLSLTIHLSVRARVAPVLRPDLGDDDRRAGQRQRDDGDLHVQVRVPAVRPRYGAAVSVVIFVICFGFALAYQGLVMRRDYTQPIN